MLAASTQDVVLAVVGTVIGLHTAAIVGTIAYLIRTREKVTRLEEWVRLHEIRRNGG